MKHFRAFPILCRHGGFLLACSLVASACAMSSSELSAELSHGTRITVVDLRSPALYAQDHIPGAINIPAALCPLKKLPPLGKVVAYGDGLGGHEEQAMAALNSKPGIHAEALDGGFAAWQDAHFATSKPRGISKERPNYITYAQLKAASPSDVLLVDLRRPRLGPRSGIALTDLDHEFPGMRHSPLSGGMAKSGGSVLLVLIDNGDGVSEKTARSLRNSGVHRYAILAGGELILARHGKSGSARRGFSVQTHAANK